MKQKSLSKWLLQYAGKTKKDFFLYCLIGLLIVVVWIILPVIISKQTLLLTGSSWEDLYHITFLIFGINFFYSILKYFISFHAQKFITATYKNLHLDIIKNFMNTKYSSIRSKNTGFYIERMTDDTIDISDFYINITDDLIDLFINIGSLVTIFLLNKLIFLLYAYFLILLFFVKKTKTKRFAEEEKKKRKNVEILMNNNIEIIKGIEEIKELNAKNYFLKKVEKNIKAFNKSLLSVGEVNRFFLFITNNAKNIFRILLVSLSIYLIMNGKLTISIALVSLNYEDSIFDLLTYMESLLKNIRIFKLSAERIGEILDEEISPKESFGKESLTKLNHNAIEINNVSFSYLEERKILNRINLAIKENSTLAIVGRSGCGKTTLFHMLTKLYNPSEGSIMLYGNHLDKLKESEIRKCIAVVSQVPYLFHMTIEENLKLSSRADDKEMIKACKIAEIHGEIMKMKDGYQTIIGEAGSNLSGGQRQRLAIARALLQNTPIILFDEATSALDNETQKALQENLKKLKNKTIITIAHRLSTIIENEQIVILENGEQNGMGTHKELLKENKIYQALYQQEDKV